MHPAVLQPAMAGPTFVPLLTNRGVRLLIARVVFGVAAMCALMPTAQGAAAVVAGGTSHTCAVTSRGSVKCWGANASGQLGVGTTTNESTPVQVASLTSGVVAVTTGGAHTCAVTNAGGVKCWGDNSSGQLGDGTTTGRTTPVDVSGLASGVIALAAGGSHTCAVLSGGGVKCWGANGSGQLGDGTTSSSATPVDVSALTSGVIAVAGGAAHTCALTGLGGVKCWGANGYGQLGDGTTAGRTTPGDVSGLTTGATVVASGGFHACATVTGGALQCWGSNGAGQVGDGTNTNRPAPVQVVGLTSGVMAVAGGGSHTCAATTAGAVKCWGDNAYGQLGDGTTSNRAAPVDVSALTSGVAAVTAGGLHTCAATSGGAVECWGSNSSGQVGDPAPSIRSSPGDVSGLTTSRALAVSGNYACAATSSGGTKCWGENGYGQLGDGTTMSRSLPVDVSGMASGVVGVAGGFSHTCAVTSGGGAACWGGNSSGELGDGTTTSSLIPVDVTGLTGVVAVTAGAYHTCALTTAGGVKCWGWNGWGQLGDGGVSPSRSSPADVSGLTSGVLAVVAGSYHTCAVKTGGAVVCWGWNGSGQLGDGTATIRFAPVPVSLTGGAVAVTAGGAHSCAVTSAGRVQCWGDNSSGQLGDRTGTTRYTPVDVDGLSSGVVAVGSGVAHTCAVTSAGGVQCWGGNSSGQLGDGTTTTRNAPVAVGGLTSGATAVGGGYLHTCASMSDGTVKCWGDNSSGQLGDGVRRAPVVVAGIEYPSIAALAPNSTVARGGAFTLTVHGGSFLPAATVRFGGASRPTTWIGVTELRAAISANDTLRPGTVQVDVLNPNGEASNAVEFRTAVAGTDLNGDAYSDILWESTDGWVAAWLMRGTTQVQNLLLYDYPVAVDGWHIVGTGDFNGDGQTDILWQSDSGYVAAWMMHGTTQVFNQLLYDYPVAIGGWHIVAVGDLDADGISDILWQDGRGYVAYWLMAVGGEGLVYQKASGLLDPRRVAAGGWTIKGTGDLNGDGMTDLIWQNADGHIAAWLMAGVTQLSSTLLCPAPAAIDGWTIVGTADMNGDGMVDLLWQQLPLNAADTMRGYLAVWFMYGLTQASTLSLTPSRVTDPTWRIVGPK